IFGPSIDSAIKDENNSYKDANMDIRKAKHQEPLDLSNHQLCESTEETEALTETEADNFPVRRWIRGHYTKITKINKVSCNHCLKNLIYVNRLDILHKHLVKTHPEKLTEEEKKDVKVNWTWDYFTLSAESKATCKICEGIMSSKTIDNLTNHLKTMHK
ncbi:hypothetical protein ALC56_02839, partial [Trachymyrmex septentrionalis]